MSTENITFVKIKSLQTYDWYLKSENLVIYVLWNHRKCEKTISDLFWNRSNAQIFRFVISPKQNSNNIKLFLATHLMECILTDYIFIWIALFPSCPLCPQKNITLNINATFCSYYCLRSLLLNINFSTYVSKMCRWKMVLHDTVQAISLSF